MMYKEVLKKTTAIKDKGILKQALLGKGKAFSFLTKMLKDTLSYEGRKRLIQGLGGMEGNHPTTILGRYILQKKDKMPSTALFKKQLQGFIGRYEKPINWDFWKGEDNFYTAVQNPREAMSRLLQRLSRRTMWTYRQPVEPITEKLRKHLNTLGQAQRAKWPNYNPDEYAKAVLAHPDFKWWQ